MAVARLEGDAVHRICSGQVIVSLASAAKETAWMQEPLE